MTLRVGYCIERGRNKLECDDSALIGETIVNDEKGTLEINTPAWICLCDGVGGYSGGREASLLVTEKLREDVLPSSEKEVRDIIERINNFLLENAGKTTNHKQMATTATAVFFSEKNTILAHIGNTRLYSKRGAYLQQLTRDQTTYQWHMARGDSEAAEACNKNEIIGAMGGGQAELIRPLITCNIFEKKLPSVLLLTSDGVHDYLSQDELEEVIASDYTLLDKARQLCEKALINGSKDDRSAILVEIMNN